MLTRLFSHSSLTASEKENLLMDLNKVSLIGNLTGDPETKVFPSGDSIVRFAVATNRTWKNPETNAPEKDVEYHALAARGKLAEIVATYLKKGSRVYCEGRLKTRKWTGKDGQKHEETTFVDVTLWARSAELASEYLHKGDPVFIEGYLQLDQWQDKEGQKRQKMRVVGERMQFLPRAGGSGSPRGPVADDQGAPPPEEFGEPAPAAEQGDNIPF